MNKQELLDLLGVKPEKLPEKVKSTRPFKVGDNVRIKEGYDIFHATGRVYTVVEVYDSKKQVPAYYILAEFGSNKRLHGFVPERALELI